MAQSLINVGNNADDGTGDTIRESGLKINEMFDELYLRPSMLSDITIDGNNISTGSSNADIDLNPSGTGGIVFPKVIFDDNNIKTTGNDNLGFIPSGTGSVIFGGLGFVGTSISAKDSSLININEALRVDSNVSTTGTFAPTGVITTSSLTVDSNINITDNEIKATTSNSDLVLTAAGTGSIHLGAVNISGTTITSDDSSSININEGLVIDGTATIENAVTFDSTLEVSSNVTVTGNLIVSGISSIPGTFSIDNLTFNDNIIGSSSNADINLTSGGLGTVNVSNLQIDSNLNFVDNNITLSSSNSDLILSASGTGSVSISKIDINEGTIDATIGAGTSAAGTFSSLTFNPTAGGTLSTTGITVTDNIVTASASNDNLELLANGSGNVCINGFKLPNADGGTGQFLKTDGNETVSFATVSVAFGESAIIDTEVELAFRTNTEIDHATSHGGHDLLISAAGTADTWATTKYDSAWYYALHRDDDSDEFEVAKHSIVHNHADAFLNSSVLIKTGTNNHIAVDADISSGNVRLRASGLSSANSMSYYRIGLGDSDSSGYGGEDEAALVIDSSIGHRTNTEIDHATSHGGHDLLISAAGTADMWATTKYDSAWYYALHRDDDSDEFEVAKHSLAHNHAGAFLNSSILIKTGTNNHIAIDGDISDGNVRLRASGLSSANSMSYYRIGLGDDDSSGYGGEDEASQVINSGIGHNVETIIDPIISTKRCNHMTSATSSLDEFVTSKYDSAFYLAISRDDDSDEFEVAKHSLAHNNSTAMVSSYALTKTGTNNHIVTSADVDSSTVRLLGSPSSSNASASWYRIGLGDDDSTGYSGEQEAGIVINTDLDSAEENLDTWAKADYRGAKYYISVNNNTKSEVQNLECVIVHDGSAAYITSYGSVNTGNNDLINVTADINGSNVRLRATGNEPNLRVHMYRILLADDEADRVSTNVNVIGEVTVSSTATAIDSFNNVGDDGATAIDGAHYIVVAYNSTEGAASICEAAVVAQGNNAFITQYAQTSTKSTGQITLTAVHDGSSTVTVKAASTSGGSTTVNAYRVQLSRPANGTTETFDSWSTSSYRGAKYFISINDETNQEINNVEVVIVHDGSDAYMTEYNNVMTSSDKFITWASDISGGNVRLRATVPGGVNNDLKIHAYRILLADNEADRTESNKISVTGDTTVSSTATIVDTFDSTEYQGAHYIVVANNSSEGAASICEAAVVTQGTNAYVTQYAQTSTKSTGQITLTAVHDGSSTVDVKASSTSGGSTKVNVYGIKLTRGEGSSTAIATLDSNVAADVRSAKYLVQTVDTEGSRYELIEANVVHDGSNAYISTYGKVSNVSDAMTTITVDISDGNLRLRGQISNVNTHMVNVVKRVINV